MRSRRLLLTVCCLAMAASLPAAAAPGDVVVPAHRTKDGHWVPANVPPASGGTHVSRRPARGSVHRVAQAPSRAALWPPLLVDAQPMRR